jgi:putative multiple sugar transport system substrate-binding protein
MPMPIVTGQDAELPSVKSMLAGEQYSTVFKDTRELAKVAVGMVDAIMSGKEPEVNDTKTYDNGVKVVPSYLLKPVAVDKTNAEKSVLVGAGYYTAEDQMNQLISRLATLSAGFAVFHARPFSHIVWDRSE